MKFPHCPSLTSPGKARCFLSYAYVTLFLHNERDKRRKGLGVDWHIGNIVSWCKVWLPFVALLAALPAQREGLRAPQDTRRFPAPPQSSDSPGERHNANARKHTLLQDFCKHWIPAPKTALRFTFFKGLSGRG